MALAACESPTEVISAARPVPADIQLALTGSNGTPVFPIAAPGERQTMGDARGLNNLGQVTGAEVGLASNGDYSPYRFTPGSGTVELRGCCNTEIGFDINDAGVIVGMTLPSFSVNVRGFVITGTTMVTLGILPGASPEGESRAIAVNNAGTIAGTSAAPDFSQRAVIWSSSGAIQDLGIPNSASIDINGSGQVIGSMKVGEATHFFRWSSGAGMQDLTTLLGALTSVVEINDAGQIIGTFTAPGGADHAFRYTPGSGLLDLGTLGGATSAPTGLNNKGQVVGTSLTSDGVAHAFLWTTTDGMEDLTVKAGINGVRRLNDNLQTLTGTAPLVYGSLGRTIPRLVQLQVTQDNLPPKALFSITCNGLTCTFDARESLDDKPGLTYAWNFGKAPDGTGSGAVATATYAHESQRTITLTVTDASGLSNSLAKTISVWALPIAEVTASCTGLTCTFDRSGSASDVNINIEYWWFGDGQVDCCGVTKTHTYAQAGTYDVTMQILDANKRTATITKRITVGSPPPPVNTAPVAAFTASCDGLTCLLDGRTSTDDKKIVSYAWNLDRYPDGSATGATTTAVYPHTGTRNVTLTVTDESGLTGSVTKQITIGGAPPPPPPPVDAAPVARFTFSCQSLTCALNATSSSDDVGIVSYSWNLDKYPDGSATGATPTVTYPHGSTRNVTLTVTDTKGQTNSVTKAITIQ